MFGKVACNCNLGNDKSQPTPEDNHLHSKEHYINCAIMRKTGNQLLNTRMRTEHCPQKHTIKK